MTTAREDIIALVRASIGVDEPDARRVIDAVLNAVVDVTLAKGTASVLPLGCFQVIFSAGKPHSVAFCPSLRFHNAARGADRKTNRDVPVKATDSGGAT